MQPFHDAFVLHVSMRVEDTHFVACVSHAASRSRGQVCTCSMRTIESASRGEESRIGILLQSAHHHSQFITSIWRMQGNETAKEPKIDSRVRAADRGGVSRDGGQPRREAQEHANGGGHNGERRTTQAVKKPRIRSRVVAAE